MLRTQETHLVAVVLVALALAAGSILPAVPAAGAPATAFVRVNQVGYATGLPKRAFLMASSAETGATFTVKDQGGSTVYSGSVGSSTGAWSNAYPAVYPLDFTPVGTPGTYTIEVTGPIPATSPSFAIDTGTNVFSPAVANALSFYRNERDGADFIPSPLRTDPAHLNDASAMTYLTPHVNQSGHFKGDLSPLGIRIDASGGWWDAGDYVKFVETTSYTEDLLLAGVRDFPGQMGSGSGSASSDFTAEARFGADWLLRMWDDPSQTLYYQVGIGTGNAKTVGDHDIWRLPQADDTFGGTDPRYRYIRNRPVFRAGPPGSLISPNLAGRDAAALGLCYQVFQATDPAFAGRCLVGAEHIFDLADTNPGRRLLTVIPYSFYPETEWRDDLELGASELYFAVAAGNLPPGLPHTDPGYYLGLAAHWAHQYITGPNDAADTLNLYDVSGLAHDDLYKAIAQAGNPPGLEVTQADLVADLKKQLDKAVAQAASDPFGFGFPWGTYDTTSHGAGLSVMAGEYDALTGTTAYAGEASGWLANILGVNAWGTSLEVGDGTVFPHCMQHQVANLVGSLDGSPPILAGAAVEGPNGIATRGALQGMRACPPDGQDTFAPFNGSGAVYKDNVESFSTVEPAIDLTASSPLAFAWQMATGDGPPPPPPPPTQTVVTIQFDDGNADQMDALPILEAHGMVGTFYVNTGVVGDATHLSWDDVTALAGAGNEIASHTIDHANLKHLKTQAARDEVCGDRVALFDHGFEPTSFAYPFGAFDAGTEAVVSACGFNSGRGVSGVDDTKTFAETIPPVDAYATRTPPNPKQGTTVATIEGYVSAAAANGGGWVQLVFHHVCDGCDAYSITAANFTELLDWLSGQSGSGVVVETTNNVIGGEVQPPIPP